MTEKTFSMIAVGTIRRGKVVEPARTVPDPMTGRTKQIPAVVEREEIQPGNLFRATAKDRDDLIAAGAARLATTVVIDEAEQRPVSPRSAPAMPDGDEAGRSAPAMRTA